MTKRVATEAGIRRYKLPLHSPIVAKPKGRVSQFFTAQTDSLNFAQAVAALNSPKHKAFAQESLRINYKYGAHTISTRDMVGDTAQYGTEDSVMQRMSVDPEVSRFIAAEKGLAGHQLSVLNFVHDKNGKDFLIGVSMPNKMKSAELRAILDKRGLEFRSIDPKTNDLMFFSGGGDKLAEIRQLAKDYANGKVSITKGSGEFIGSDESREVAADVYRGILKGSRRNGSNRVGLSNTDHGSQKESCLGRLSRKYNVNRY